MKQLITLLPTLLFVFVTACSAQETNETEFRYWTTAKGRKSDIKLKLVGQTSDSVELERQDSGKIVTLKIDSLSDADKQYITSLKSTSNPSATASSTASNQDVRNNWSQFRGPKGAGISDDGGLPVRWSDSQNIAWKKQLPGPGSSSPITWGDHVYVTCYSGYGLSRESPGNKDDLVRHLLCFSHDDGKLLWKVDVAARGKKNMDFAGFNALHGFTTSTPIADETGVYVSFATNGVFCYSHDGKRKWQADIGEGTNGWGTSASPLIFEDFVIIHADIESRAMIAINKTDGNEEWRASTGNADSWSTPLLLKAGDRNELVFHHSQGDPVATLAAIDPRDGKSLWECKVLKDYLCPTPIENDGIVYTIAYGRGAAIRAGGSGDVTDSHVIWKNNVGPEICSPMYHDGHLYFSHQENGIAYCINAKTGEKVYEKRLEPSSRHIYASGVMADGKIYYVSKENGTYVVAAKPQFEQLAHNKIESDDSIFNGSPAVSRGRLLIRSDKFLYCIGEK